MLQLKNMNSLGFGISSRYEIKAKNRIDAVRAAPRFLTNSIVLTVLEAQIMTILESHAAMVNEALDEQDVTNNGHKDNPITKRAQARSIRQNQRAYALATFIFGCLVREEVLHFDPNDSDLQSDMQIGIRIIAACIKNYIDTDEHFGLPFEW